MLEPEVLRHIPTTGRTTSRRSSSRCCSRWAGRSTGTSFDGYWQDIGNLDQYRQANFDALDERVRLNDPRDPPAREHLARGGRGRRRPRARSRARRSSATTAGSRRTRPSARTRCSPPSVNAARARAHRALRDRRRRPTSGAARSSRAPIVGRNCDIRAHVARPGGRRDRRRGHARRRERRHARACGSIPYKEVESGAQIHESLIWESRAPLAAVRRGRRLRARQRRPDARDGGAPGGGARHGAQARRAGRRQPRVAAGLPDDQARDDLGAHLDRRRASPTCASCPRRSTATC